MRKVYVYSYAHMWGRVFVPLPSYKLVLVVYFKPDIIITAYAFKKKKKLFDISSAILVFELVKISALVILQWKTLNNVDKQ